MNSREISRKIPKAVKLALRREVGFGCPLCGNPHLEYHHFDPPWREQNHHDVDGMIALCGRHHDEADTGAFNNEQLRLLKINNHSQIGGSFNWKRKHTVFACGGNYAYQCGAVLTARGIDMIYFEKDDEGYDTLSLNIYDTCFNKIAEMRKNDWICRNNVEEIEAAPRTPKLTIKSAIHRINMELEFKCRDKMNLGELEILQRFGIPPDENALIISLRGSLPAPCYAEITDDLLMVNGSHHFSSGLFSNCGKAIVIG